MNRKKVELPGWDKVTCMYTCMYVHMQVGR